MCNAAMNLPARVGGRLFASEMGKEMILGKTDKELDGDVTRVGFEMPSGLHD